jgi:hypothetical protein
MSRILAEQVTCPQCSDVRIRDVVYSVNGGRAPHLRQAVLDGTFGRVACEACGSSFGVDHPFLYVDFEHVQWFGVFHPAQEKDWVHHEREIARSYHLAFGERAPEVARSLGYGMRTRVVFGLSALREKLLAMEAGLDDLMLEATKLRLLLAGGVQQWVAGNRLRLESVDETVLVLRWVPPPDAEDADTSAVHVLREAYDDIAFNPMEWREVLDALCLGPWVDASRVLLTGAA